MIKAIEYEGELNEQEEEEEIEKNTYEMHGIIDRQKLQTIEDFKNSLIELDQSRVKQILQQSEEAIEEQGNILDKIENIKKEQENQQIQFIGKVFNQLPYYVQKVQNIQIMLKSNQELFEQLRKRKCID